MFIEPLKADGTPCQLGATGVRDDWQPAMYAVAAVYRAKVGLKNIRLRLARDLSPRTLGGRAAIAFTAVDDLLESDLHVNIKCARCGRELKIVFADDAGARGECESCLVSTRTGRPVVFFPAGA